MESIRHSRRIVEFEILNMNFTGVSSRLASSYTTNIKRDLFWKVPEISVTISR